MAATDVYVSIGGTQYATGRASASVGVLMSTLTITEVLNSPNTCTFTVKGFAPTAGQEVIITLGSSGATDRLFAGLILNVEQDYLGEKPANIVYVVSAIDYTWLLGRRLVVGQYASVSATTIATDLMSAFSSGFTTTNVQASLPTVDLITFTNQTLPEALTNLAAAIGGYWYIDYHRDLHFYLTDTATNPADLTVSHPTLSAFQITMDNSPWITRVYQEGGGGTAFYDTPVGATVLPVDTDVWYQTSGGVVVSGPQRITYTGIGAGYVPPIIDQVSRTLPSSTNWTRVLWVSELALFVAIQQSGAATSPDGVTWTARTTPTSGGTYDGLAWAPSLGLLVTVANTGVIATSPDGVTWTSQTPPTGSPALAAVAWSPSLNLFAAVGTNVVATSPDGITWTLRTAASSSGWSDVVWADTLGLFVACQPGGGTACIMTSPDGITWTLQTTPGGAVLIRLAWSHELNLLAAVGGFSTPAGYVQTSADGITWTNRTAANNNNWRPVTWVKELGVFVAASIDGAAVTGRRVMTSPDGITWTDWATPTAGLWQSVTWSPELSVIVIIGTTGASILAMTSTIQRYPTLTGIPSSGPGSILYPINAGDQVNLLVQVDDTGAQTALAAAVGGDGVQEAYFQDGRISYTEALAEATAQLELHNHADVSITYSVRDTNTAAGRTVHVNLASPTSVTGDFRIQQVTISQFLPAQYPTYAVQASSSRFTFEDLLRLAQQAAAA